MNNDTTKFTESSTAPDVLLKPTEWITNVYDPNRPNAQNNLSLEYGGGSPDEQWANYLAWIKQFRIGPPVASKAYTVQQMQEEGLVGLYEKDGPGESIEMRQYVWSKLDALFTKYHKQSA